MIDSIDLIVEPLPAFITQCRSICCSSPDRNDHLLVHACLSRVTKVASRQGGDSGSTQYSELGLHIRFTLYKRWSDPLWRYPGMFAFGQETAARVLRLHDEDVAIGVDRPSDQRSWHFISGCSKSVVNYKSQHEADISIDEQ